MTAVVGLLMGIKRDRKETKGERRNEAKGTRK
jgi:hypothetical protein